VAFRGLCGGKRRAFRAGTRHPDVRRDGAAGGSYSAWYGLFAPRGTPRDIVGKLNAAVAEALADPAVQFRRVDLGVEVFPCDQQTPDALGARLKADAGKW
jgi:tripartite-type tricarboxylate transporter receptor subunit TctC